MSHPTDQDILAQLAQPSTRQLAFRRLVERYREPIYWHVRRLVVVHEDAEDVAQEAFVSVYRYIDRFKGEASLKTWIYRIATNEALRHLRRKRLETTSYCENSKIIELYAHDSLVDYSSVEARLQRAILALPPTQRVVFNLRYYDEMSYDEIATITESSVASLKSSYHYAAAKVKEQMLRNID